MAAPRTADSQTLHLITKRLSACTPKTLPITIPQITKSLLGCKSLLSSSSDLPSNSDDAQKIHRLESQVSRLLNDKTPQAQWAAVVLIKTLLEIGGYSTLSKSATWVRGLQSILARSLPPSTTQLCIVTLTRIFDMTRPHPALVREITTPSLPPFINACFHQVSREAAAGHSTLLLTTVIESFCHLLPNHPSIFRNFLSQIHKMLAPLVAYTFDPRSEANTAPSPELADAARSLFILTYSCAPKAGGAAEYASKLDTVLEELDLVVNQVFRAVKEEAQPYNASGASKAPQSHAVEPHLAESKLGLPGWTGIHAGCERLRGLLCILRKSVELETSIAVPFSLGAVLELFTRLCAVTVPLNSGRGESTSSMKINDLISREEREALWSELPQIHGTAITVIEAICVRFGDAAKSTHQHLVELLSWVFSNEKQDEDVREACYGLAAYIMERSAAGLPESSIRSMAPLLEACCNDILPPKLEDSKQDQVGKTLLQAVSNQPTPQSTVSAADRLNEHSGLQQSARDLLVSALSQVPFQYLSSSVRVQLERTAVLANDSDAMLASTLNPAPGDHSSLVTFLARAEPGAPATESFVRPRLLQVGLVSNRIDDTRNLDNQRGEETTSQTEATGSQFRFGQPSAEMDDVDVNEREAQSNERGLAKLHALARELEADGLLHRRNMVTVDPSPLLETAAQPSSISPQEASTVRKRLKSDTHVQSQDPKRQRVGTDDKADDAEGLPIMQAEQLIPPEPGQPATEQNVLVVPKSKPDVAEIDDDDDDDEDFVMPPLTLEPDTEDEDEDEEE